MGVLKAPRRMKQLLCKDTVYGIIGDQIFERTRMFASREQVISLIEKATMGMEELTDFPKNPVADAQKLLGNMKEEVGAAAEQDPKEDPEVGDGAEEDGEHSLSVREDEVTPTHAVFGSLISVRLRNTCAGWVPVMLIVLYSDWDSVMKSFLHLLNTEAFIVQTGPGLVLPTTRWTGDTRRTRFAEDHLAVGTVGHFGLSSFSFGNLVFM